MSAPLIRPMSPAKISEMISVGSTPTPQFFIMMAMRRPVTAMFEPTERSMPPEDDDERHADGDDEVRRDLLKHVEQLLLVRNTGCASCRSRQSTTRAMSMPTMFVGRGNFLLAAAALLDGGIGKAENADEQQVDAHHEEGALIAVEGEKQVFRAAQLDLLHFLQKRRIRFLPQHAGHFHLRLRLFVGVHARVDVGDGASIALHIAPQSHQRHAQHQTDDQQDLHVLFHLAVPPYAVCRSPPVA